jgi:hypothetical protein
MDNQMNDLFKAIKSNDEGSVVSIVKDIVATPKSNVIDFPSRKDSTIVGLNLFQIVNATISSHGLALTEELLKDYLKGVQELRIKHGA